MGISQCLETLFTVTAVRVLLASGGERPGVMLNSSQESPAQLRMVQPQISLVLNLRNPEIGHFPIRGQKPHSILNRER